ncbi:hypothetical protein RRG08_066369 [Elysia crispata]|uniref:Uncharacterized protein n=1 Tax=Elysia crispata TaxID=231223 RepID=A0AAE1CVF4_9GAST|nr:hypothetical protein RRG08_066369 [Elysia crispata]
MGEITKRRLVFKTQRGTEHGHSIDDGKTAPRRRKGGIKRELVHPEASQELSGLDLAMSESSPSSRETAKKTFASGMAGSEDLWKHAKFRLSSALSLCD